MASYQYVYHMDGVSKTYPGGKNVSRTSAELSSRLKIGVVGRERRGQVDAAADHRGAGTRIQRRGLGREGARVGYLPQEPQLDEAVNVRANVMQGVAEKKASSTGSTNWR